MKAKQPGFESPAQVAEKAEAQEAVPPAGVLGAPPLNLMPQRFPCEQTQTHARARSLVEGFSTVWQPGFESPAVQAGRKALFACSPAARRAAKSVRKALLCKAAETDVHAAGFGMKIGGLRPSDASHGFFDSLSSRVLKPGCFAHVFQKSWKHKLIHPWPLSKMLSTPCAGRPHAYPLGMPQAAGKIGA